MSENRTVKLLRDCVAGGTDRKKGEIVKVSAYDAHALICQGRGVYQEPDEQAKKKAKK